MFEGHLKKSFDRKQKIRPDNWLKRLFYLVFQQSGVGFEKAYADSRTPSGTYCVSFDEYKSIQRRARIFSILTLFFVSTSILLVSIYFPPRGYYHGAAQSLVVCPVAVDGCDYTTIAAGVAAADDGDVVVVRAGTYSENLNNLDSKTNLTIQGAGWDDTFIVGSLDVAVLTCNNCDGLTIENLNVSGVSAETLKFGIAVTNSDNVTIRNNKINGQSTGYGGIAVANVNGTIKNNIVYDTATMGVMTQTIGGGSNEVFVHNNVIHDAGSAGLISTGSGIKARVVNNIIAGTISNALQTTDSGALYSYYNDIYGVTNAYADVTDSANDLTDDPLFINEANDNFYLKPTSPCINAGDPTRTLPSGYVPGNNLPNLSLLVNSTTNILAGDTIFITDGVNAENGTVDSIDVNTNTITLDTGFTNTYDANTAYVYTATSDYSAEQSASGSRINIGAQGGLVYASNGQTQSAIFVDDTNGNDNYNGTLATFVSGADGPKKSIQAGLEYVASGGTVTVAAGDYTENVTISQSNITLTGAAAATTTVSAGGSGNALTISGASDVTVSNFTFKEAERGISLSSSSNNTISDSIISDNTSTLNTWDYRASMSPLYYNSNLYNSIVAVGGPRGLTYFMGGNNVTQVSQDNTMVTALTGAEHLNLALVSVGTTTRPAVFLPDSVAASEASALTIFQGWWGNSGTVTIDYWQSTAWQNSTPGEVGGTYTWAADEAVTAASSGYEASLTPLSYSNTNYSDAVYYLIGDSLQLVYSQADIIGGVTGNTDLYAAVGTDESANKITGFLEASTWGTNCEELEEQILSRLGDTFNCEYFSANPVWLEQGKNQDFIWSTDSNLATANDVAYQGPTLSYNIYQSSLTGSLASGNYGIYFDSSNNNVVEDTTFTNNGTSIYFTESTGNEIIDSSVAANSYEVQSELTVAGVNYLKNVDFDYTSVSLDFESEIDVYYRAKARITAKNGRTVGSASVKLRDNANTLAQTLTTNQNGQTEFSDPVLAYKLSFAGIYDDKRPFSFLVDHQQYISGLQSFSLDEASVISDILLHLLPQSAPTCRISVSSKVVSWGEGEVVILNWSSRKAKEATLEALSDLGLEDLGSQETAGSLEVVPETTTVYTLRVKNESLQNTCKVEVKVELPLEPPQCSLTVEPTSITQGEPVTLSWQSEYALSGYFTPEILIDDFDVREGSVEIYPEDATTYELTVFKEEEEATCQAEEVTVIAGSPVCTLSVDEESIEYGESTILRWTSKFARTASLNPEVPDWDFSSGEIEISPLEDTTYILIVENKDLRGSCGADIEVRPLEKRPTCSLKINPADLVAGDSAVLTWQTTDTREANLSSLDLDISLPGGSTTLKPLETTTYTLEVTNVTEKNTCEITINVTEEPPTCQLTISPEEIVPGQVYTLNWQTTNTTEAKLDYGLGKVGPGKGSLELVAIEPLTYTMEVVNQRLTSKCSVPLEISLVEEVEEEEEEAEEVLSARRREEERSSEAESSGSEEEGSAKIRRIVFHDLGENEYLNQSRPQISGEAFSGWPIDIYLNDEKIETILPNEEGVFIYQPAQDLSDGEYVLEIKVGLLNEILDFIIDTKPPVQPRVQSQITALKVSPVVATKGQFSADILFKGELSQEEFDELDHLILTVESDTHQEIFKPEGLIWERVVSVELGMGKHQSYVQAKDRAGNLSTPSEPQIFEIRLPACNDGLDNDKDGLIDYPDDPGCLDANDGNESDIQQSLASAVEKVGQTTKDVVEPVQKVFSGSAKAVKEVGEALADTAVVTEIREEVLDNPIVEEVNEEYLAPAMVTVATANVATGLGWAGFLAYFKYLIIFFTEPLYLFARRKRKAWGIVYNSFTEKPLGLAVVRVFEAQNKKLAATSVTDNQGRYRFILPAGKYYLEASKPAFVFPGQFSLDKEFDYKYSHLYHGGEFEIKPGQELVELNIPLDPEGKEKPNKNILWNYWVKRFQTSLAFVGPVFGLISFAISPSTILMSLLLIHLLLYILFKKLLAPRAFKRIGRIYDSENRKAVKRAIVRIYETSLNKLLDTQITDSHGHYNFLVGQGMYYLTVEHQDYRSYKSQPVNTFGRREEDLIVSNNVALHKKNMVS